MSNPQIMVAQSAGIVGVRIIGRATFQLSQCLRDFGTRALQEGASNIVFDLSECSGMDSTILGILAMLGLEGRGKANLFLVNASDEVKNLIRTIGVARLFNVTQNNIPEVNWASLCEVVAADKSNDTDMGDTVLEAHKTLIKIDPEHNEPKFKDLVELLDREIQRRDN